MSRRIYYNGDYEISGKAAQSQRGQLKYDRDDNKAWFAPQGQQPARNWRRAMYFTRSKSGKCSFQFHDKCTIANTPATKLNQSVFGANATVVRALLDDDYSYNQLLIVYTAFKDQISPFKSWLNSVIAPILKNKGSLFSFIGAGVTLRIKNPWNPSLIGNDISVPDDILRKFAVYLCGATISVDGKKVAGYPSPDDTLGDFVESNFNDGSFILRGRVGSELKDVLYKNQPLYNDSGAMVTDDITVREEFFYTTPPNA